MKSLNFQKTYDNLTKAIPKKAIAEAIGVCPNTISNIYSGKSKITKDRNNLLIKYFEDRKETCFYL